jgi:RNA polymerase sigma factor (sigma-70 family)
MVAPNNRTYLFEERSGLELWSRLREGDHKAYESIYRNHIDLIYAYGIKLCRNEQLVEDCAHDLFVEIWNKRKQLAITSSVKFYLLKAIRRKILRSLRTDQRNNELNPFESDVLQEMSIEEILVSNQSMHDHESKLKVALESLTKRQKEAIHLKFYCNFDYEQIAEIMNISIEAVYNLVHKSISRLKDLISFFILLILIIYLL